MADIPATLYSWSTTESANAPSGTTTIGTGLDDNLRALQKCVRGWLSSKGADIASAATTDLGAIEGLFHDITGTITITSFGTVAAGIWKVIKFEGILTLTHNATSLILPGGVNITTAVGDMLMATSEGSGNWRVNWYERAGATTPTVQVFTASGTYTKPASITSIIVEVVGGGGGSGGCAATSASQAAGAGGGGGGGYAIERLATASVGATETVTVGAGGTAGAAGANTGGSGGTTSFGALVSATGGAGGAGMSATSADALGGAGGAGGAGSGGNVNIPGGGGGHGIAFGVSMQGLGGFGGHSLLSGGSAGLGISGTSTGNSGLNYGGGASGSASGPSQVATAGAAGAAGIVIVTEFY